MRLSQSLEVLAQAHHIKGLTKLCIGQTRVNAEPLAHLVQSPMAQHLEHIELSYLFDEDPGPVRHLCEGIKNSPYLHQLTHLVLDDLDMADEALISLSQAPQCRALTKLSLEGSDFSEKGLRAFAASPYFTHLEELELGLDYDYPDEPMSAQRRILFDSPHLPEAIRIRFDPSMHLDEV